MNKHGAQRRGFGGSGCPCPGECTYAAHSLLRDHMSSLMSHSGLCSLVERENAAKVKHLRTSERDILPISKDC